jgi:glycosyltransferase involved in cell wall biosynthesis
LIRIAYVIPTLDQSGAERQLTLLANGLPRDEYEPHVLALNRGGHYAQVLKNQQIPVHVLGKRFRFDVLTWIRLRSLLKTIQPQIVQSYIFAANSYVRLPGICPPVSKVIVSERCVDSWKSNWQKSLDRRLADRMDAMTANSQSVADFYSTEIGIPTERLHVIPNGVPELPSTEPGQLHKELGIPSNCKLIGFSGRLAPQKNLRDLIWAFHLFAQGTPDPVALVFIGDGPQRDSLAQFVTDLGQRDIVHFMGHRNDAAELVRDLSTFCLPSAFEGMSNSLMEAMANGIPCVVSDIAPNRELIEHEQNGLVFPVGDTTRLAKALLRCHNEEDFSRQLGLAAQARIANEHSVASLVNRHHNLYQQLLSGASTVSATAQEIQ